jgi:uncharacterized membrane protein
MENEAKMVGHPVHPILVPFPLGLLTTSVIFDIVHVLTSGSRWAGDLFLDDSRRRRRGLLAVVFGLIDWLAIPPGTREGDRVGA